MPKSVPEIPSAASAIGPYSVATETAGLVFISGQVALDPATGERSPDDVVEQTHRVMKNIGAILEDLGLAYSDIAKTTIYLTRMSDYPDVNAAYGSYFESEPPARAAVEVSALPAGFLIEIEAVASR